MSALPSQAVVRDGQHLADPVSGPAPRPSWLLVLNSCMLTGCLMEVTLRQRASFVELKHCSFIEDLSSNHSWRPWGPSSIAGKWSHLPVVTQNAKGQAGPPTIESSGHETSISTICHIHSVFLRWHSEIIHPKGVLGKQGLRNKVRGRQMNLCQGREA